MAPRAVAEVLKEFNHIKPTNFRSTSGNASETARQWKKYLTRFENIFDILSLKDEDDATKVKLLQAHEYDIVRKAEASIDDTQVTAESGVYKKLKKKLNLYFQIPTLEEYARNKLALITQRDGQTASDLLVEIKELISDAGWGEASNVTEQIKATLLKALKSETVRQQYRFSLLAGKTELTLSAIVEVANVIERSAVTSQRNNASDPMVQAVRHYQPRQFRPQGNQNQRNQYQGKNQNQPTRRCFGCGSSQHRSNKDPKCPARDVICHGCSKKGHFQKLCRSGGNSRKNPRSYNKNRYSKKNFVKKVEYEGAQAANNSGASAGPSSVDSKVDSLQADLANRVFF